MPFLLIFSFRIRSVRNTTENGFSGHPIIYQDNHLKRCISENSILNEHARRKEILKSIDRREFQIWQYKQYILENRGVICIRQMQIFGGLSAKKADLIHLLD